MGRLALAPVGLLFPPFPTVVYAPLTPFFLLRVVSLKCRFVWNVSQSCVPTYPFPTLLLLFPF